MHKRIGVATPIIWNHPVLRRVISEALPDAIVHQGTHVMDEDELIAFLRGCDSAIIGFEPLTEKVLAALPGLKVVSKFGAG